MVGVIRSRVLWLGVDLVGVTRSGLLWSGANLIGVIRSWLLWSRVDLVGVTRSGLLWSGNDLDEVTMLGRPDQGGEVRLTRSDDQIGVASVYETTWLVSHSHITTKITFFAECYPRQSLCRV